MLAHGITVIIPENAVNTDTVLSIGVYYINSFQIPKSHRLVSEVFWIKTSVPLHKNAELFVPHFVKVRDEEDSNKLGFFVASDISTEDIQTFTKVPANSCSFEPESSYGKLVMEHFCSGCILERIDRNGLPLRYLITRVFPYDSEEKEKWKADFVFSYALKSCLMVCTHKCMSQNKIIHLISTIVIFGFQVIEKQYPKDGYLLAKKSVTFTQSSVTLDYELEPVLGWFITQDDITRMVRGTHALQLISNKKHYIYVYCFLKQISAKEIDYHNLIAQTSDTTKQLLALLELEKIHEYPPRLSLQITRSKNAQERLKTNVIVKGVEPQVNFQIFAKCPGQRLS